MLLRAFARSARSLAMLDFGSRPRNETAANLEHRWSGARAVWAWQPIARGALARRLQGLDAVGRSALPPAAACLALVSRSAAPASLAPKVQARRPRQRVQQHECNSPRGPQKAAESCWELQKGSFP
eukprot:4122566-Alexandrium_andersonii.AAC.1